jgi:hypothetical protein
VGQCGLWNCHPRKFILFAKRAARVIMI